MILLIVNKPPGNLQNPLVAKNGRFPRFYFRRDTQHIRQEHITDLAIAPIANTQTTPVISKHTQTKLDLTFYPGYIRPVFSTSKSEGGKEPLRHNKLHKQQ